MFNNTTTNEIDGSCPRPLIKQSIHVLIVTLVFPVLFVIGFFGNILILLVLRSMAMRRKTTVLLMCMAGADLIFLLTRIPGMLAVFETFAYWNPFRHFYYETHNPLVFFCNWMSGASIWFALAVTVERTVAIRSPFMALHMVWKMCYFRILTSGIVICSFIFSLHYLVWYKFKDLGTCIESSNLVHRSNIPDDDYLEFVKPAIILREIFVVGGPMVIMILLNGLLTFYIHSHRRNQDTMRSTYYRAGSSSSRSRNERKVTVIVWAIVCVFVLLNLPSTVLHLWSLRVGKSRPAWHRSAIHVTNILVATGKAINFILYCIVSAQFRKKAKMILSYLQCCPIVERQSGASTAPTSDRSIRHNPKVKCPLTPWRGRQSNSFQSINQAGRQDEVRGQETDPLNEEKLIYVKADTGTTCVNRALCDASREIGETAV